MSQLHDVVIVGAGPGGAAAAAFMARAGLDVVLLDKADFPRDKACGDLIGPIAIGVLAGLGLLAALRDSGYRVDGTAVTSPAGDIFRGPVPPHPTLPNYGYVVKRYILDALICQAAVEAGARFEAGIHVKDVCQDATEGLTVLGERANGRTQHRGRLVILAVGANVTLLQALGLAPRRIPFAYAARAYYEGVQGLDRYIHVRFDGVSLPGGGWIFPLSAETANVGAGFYQRSRRTPPTAASALRTFLAHPAVRDRLAGARQVGPVKGFPLRTDFHRSPVISERLLLVGEAAGLVSPLSGEGISFALESARIAGDCAQAWFTEGDFSRAALTSYERRLRTRFQRMFVFSHLLRRVYMNPLLLDPMVRACNRWPDVGRLAVDVLLSYQDPALVLSPRVLVKAVSSLLRDHGNR